MPTPSYLIITGSQQQFANGIAGLLLLVYELADAGHNLFVRLVGQTSGRRREKEQRGGTS